MKNNQNSTEFDKFKSSFRFFVIAVGGLYVAIAGLVFFGYEINHHRVQAGENAHQAICALKKDIARRHDAGVDFLNKHPNGIPGIPRAVIATSVKGQADTLKALASLECKHDFFGNR